MESLRKEEIINNIRNIECTVDRALLESTNIEIDNFEIIIASKHQRIDEMVFAKSLFKKKSVFGENIAQELRDKYISSQVFDFIGNIQTNKIKYLVGKTRLIQSVDNLCTCDEIQRLCEKKGIFQNILVQINAGNEASKGGIRIEEASKLIDSIKMYNKIIAKGLMIVTPLAINQSSLIEYFKSSKQLFDSIKKNISTFQHLSMGMTNDYLTAILNGSNMVRLGRAIFGERHIKR